MEGSIRVVSGIPAGDIPMVHVFGSRVYSYPVRTCVVSKVNLAEKGRPDHN